VYGQVRRVTLIERPSLGARGRGSPRFASRAGALSVIDKRDPSAFTLITLILSLPRERIGRDSRTTRFERGAGARALCQRELAGDYVILSSPRTRVLLPFYHIECSKLSCSFTPHAGSNRARRVSLHSFPISRDCIEGKSVGRNGWRLLEVKRFLRRGNRRVFPRRHRQRTTEGGRSFPRV